MKKIILIGLFCSFFAFYAWASPKYEAEVSVDETAKSITEAKAKAISKAMREGLNEVILGISTEKSVEEINKLNDNQLEHFITEVMVLMEKTSDVRYIANLKISIDGDILKAYLKENNLPIVISEEKEVVVVPLLEKEDGQLDVWSEDNFWRQAFLNRSNLRRSNLNIYLIDKNLGNIAMIKPNRLFDMVQGEYQELMKFNRADIFYVLKYSQKDKKIFVKRYPSGETQEIVIESDNLNEMADKTISIFKDVKSDKSEELSFSTAQVEVIYNYNQLSDWISLKKLLDDNPQVQDIRLISMANSKVHFNFQYSGVPERLQGTLGANGYKMKREGDHYVIY